MGVVRHLLKEKSLEERLDNLVKVSKKIDSIDPLPSIISYYLRGTGNPFFSLIGYALNIGEIIYKYKKIYVPYWKTTHNPLGISFFLFKETMRLSFNFYNLLIGALPTYYWIMLYERKNYLRDSRK